MFSEPQVKALSSKLSAKHVRTRQHSGLTLSYIEGWHAIAEANRIFGYDAWDRQTMAVRCVWEGTRERQSACSYIARVRVRVRAGDCEICREGCGSGHGVGPTPGEAHESAIKEAETDAMKRALSTFGNPFGLALYDREQQNVRGRRKKVPKSAGNGQGKPIAWLVLSSEGEYLSAHEDPVDYCKAMRQLLEAISTRERLRAFWQRNVVTLAMMRRNRPDLKTEKGEHYAEILTSLYKHQMRLVTEEEKAYEQRARELAAAAEGDMTNASSGRALQRQEHSSDDRSQPGTKNDRSTAADGSISREEGAAAEPDDFKEGRPQDTSSVKLARENRSRAGADGDPRSAARDSDGEKSRDRTDENRAVNSDTRHVDKTKLPISAPRRIRDKDHLHYVASQPCIICGRSPSQAHHLRFAQPRAMGRKISDEWTVPLCTAHHSSLHSCGDESEWWAERGLDPIAHAVRLWWDTKHGGDKSRQKVDIPNT
jgi:DNA recombination protein Rad52